MFAESSVFVLPSITEGSAKTTYEAMAAGLPVITTPNSGSLIRDGVDGFLVGIRNPEAIGERILHLYRNREEAGSMGEAARRHVAEYSWERYEDRMISLYRELAGNGGTA